MPLAVERRRSDEAVTAASQLYGMELVDPSSSTSARERNPIISYYHDDLVVTGEPEHDVDETWPNQIARPSLLVRQLSEFAQLPDNWDGDGAVSTTWQAIATARRILAAVGVIAEYLGMEMFVDPLPNGGLDMEWVSRAENQILAEIYPNGRDISLAICKKNRLNGKREYRSDRLSDIDQLLTLLLWLDR